MPKSNIKTRTVFLNGKFVPDSRAVVPVDTHALHYGTGCFEGIRAYWNNDRTRLYVFRQKEHYQRLARSAKMLSLKIPYSPDQLCRITVRLLQKNNYREDVYIRPLVYKSERGVTKFNLDKLSDGLTVFTEPLGRYLNVSGGVRVVLSDWLRVDARMIPPFAKPTGLYLNTALAKTDAERKGFAEAILPNADGSISEGSAENIFLVINNRLVTPSKDQNILEGITRATIIELAGKELKMKTKERRVKKEELFKASEIFLTGTGAEVTPVVEIGGKKVGSGSVGPVTATLQSLYFDIVHGNNPKYHRWLTEV